MITDETLGYAPFRYLNDAGWFSGYVVGINTDDPEVVITAASEQGDRSELARRPIRQWQDYRDIIAQYADEQETELYELTG
jgi:hypothetical protein